eukprot:gene33087-25050_t
MSPYAGYLAAGDDLPKGGKMSLKEALRRARADPHCVTLKSRWALVAAGGGGDGWTSWRK